MIINQTIPCEANHQFAEEIICAYQNHSSNWQIIKITNISDYYWEKVLLPQQKIIFQAPSQAVLKVFSAHNITSVLEDTIACHKLKIN